MSVRKATRESEYGAASAENEIWKRDLGGYRVLDNLTGEIHYVSEERVDGLERVRACQGIIFKPMKGA